MQNEDDIAVCVCAIESECREFCLNTLTSVECTVGHCPCGNLCQNQVRHLDRGNASVSDASTCIQSLQVRDSNKGFTFYGSSFGLRKSLDRM